MPEVTAGEAAVAFPAGMHAALVDAGSASAESDEELNTASAVRPLPGQAPEGSYDHGRDDYIVTYCMCLHEPSCARAEQDSQG